MCTTIFSTAMPRNDDASAVAQLTVSPEGVSNKQSHAQRSMAEKAYYLSSVIRRIQVLYKHTACEEAMEQWVRVRNEQDRQLLKWLIETIGEAAIVKAAHACARGDAKPYLSTVCRQLGVSVPRLSTQRSHPGEVGEQHLQVIYHILQCPRTHPRTGL
jgi:hypothetical protein